MMKIILATDGTSHSEAASGILARLGLSSGDMVKVVCVIDMMMPMAVDVYGAAMPDTTAIENAARQHAARVIEETTKKLAATLPEISIEHEVLFGSPDSRIVESDEEFGADLIVIGSHGYNRWERLLLGSVSDSVVHHAPCSVLIARSPAE
jgi:nucleotide-binding universal stress UspA family protein